MDDFDMDRPFSLDELPSSDSARATFHATRAELLLAMTASDPSSPEWWVNRMLARAGVHAQLALAYATMAAARNVPRGT